MQYFCGAGTLSMECSVLQTVKPSAPDDYLFAHVCFNIPISIGEFLGGKIIVVDQRVVTC